MGRNIIGRTLRVTALSALALIVAATTMAATPRQAAAAGATMGWDKPMCDATTTTRQLSVLAPFVTAYDDTAGTDVNTVRYWTRLYNATTGAPITSWFFAGEARATDRSYAPFSVAGTVYGQQWSVRYPIANGTPNVRVQYFIAWYRTDGSLRDSQTPSVVSYRLAQKTTTYVYGSGWVTQLGFTNAGSC